MKDEIMKLLAESYDKGVADALQTMQDSAQDIIDAAVQAERDKFCAALRLLHDSYSCGSTWEKK